MKKLFIVALALTLGFGLSACGAATTTTLANTTTTSTPEDMVLNWNIGAEPLTIDPGLNGASDGGDVISQTFEGLVREVNGVVQPGIAETWELSEDGLTLTFHLRHSQWSDGSELTASDFVYAWKRAMNPATASEYAWLWEYTNVVGAFDVVNGEGSLDDVGVVATDAYTLTVSLIRPTVYLVSLLAFNHFMPVKQSAVEAVGGEEGAWAINPELVVSNGAFVLTGYQLGGGLTLEKNEYFWDADNVQIDIINGKFIDDVASAYVGFTMGTLDYIPDVPPALVAALKVESPEFYIFPLLGTYYANFNMDKALFENKNLRLALTYAIDREAICEALSGGQLPATGFVSGGFLDNEGNDFGATSGTYGIDPNQGNYAQAVTLFAAAAAELSMSVAALQAAVGEMTYLYNVSAAHQLVAEMIQASWNTVLGVEVSIDTQIWATFQNTRRDGLYDIARGGWLTDYMDPSGMLAIFTTENSYNDPNYSSEAYDTLMEEAMTATTAAVHFAKLYDALDVLMNDLPIIPIYYYTDILMAKSYLKGWERSILGTIDFTRAYIEN